jgi:hypothetical protein
MQDTTAHSRSGALLRTLALYFVAFTFITAWLPLVRSILDGPSYQWGADYFSHRLAGSGLDGDFWFLIAQGAAALAMLYLGFRRAGVFAYLLLGAWLALNLANVVHAYVFEDGGIEFHGDTLGVVFNVTIVGMALYGGGLVATIAAAWLEHAHGKRPPRFAWTNANTIVLSAAVALLPIQFLLLRYAVGRDLADQVGVILTLLQWFLIVIAFAIARKRPI